MSHSNTPPVRNRALLTARSSSLRCVSAAEHQTAEQCSKTGRTKPRKHLPRSARQDFLKIPSLCEAALETERRCFSEVIFESNVTPKITRSSDSFCTVPPIVNGGDWEFPCCCFRAVVSVLLFPCCCSRAVVPVLLFMCFYSHAVINMLLFIYCYS